ncbi:cupredoxin domain-containing protein [Gorillibacterium timonense]|uniref:cupredoxin domain-containing protein n=1 Tax=Gorillibacterium timonense TaxID=1689269 RepID=UPI00071D38CE|nr:cupredoxin domain-containing protein [Gorillibacterium timonense]
MFTTIRIRKSAVAAVLTVLCLGLIAGGYYYGNGRAWTASAPAAPERIIDMVAGEFSSTQNGKEVEAYVWHPGTVIAEKGETVTLRIRGINGASHPFYIEGTDVKGVVKKGMTTSVTFTPPKEGTYRIICTEHPDAAHNGPMIAYLVVD